MSKKRNFHVVLQMHRRGQDCEFYHIESRGKNNITNLRKLQSTIAFKLEIICLTNPEIYSRLKLSPSGLMA